MILILLFVGRDSSRAPLVTVPGATEPLTTNTHASGATDTLVMAVAYATLGGHTLTQTKDDAPVEVGIEL